LFWATLVDVSYTNEKLVFQGMGEDGFFRMWWF